ncbi:MAG TPA: (d)CMP kinase [Patescibacteria group bacterium]|nr:(d)CMP kinase [Patescibacteria group bacterium]
MKNFQIAIDGPVAAGKGTVSRLVAQRLGFLYVDTGAMYRVACLLALRANIPLEDETSVVQVVKQHKISMHTPTADEQDGRLTTVLIDNEDVSWKIRTVEVSRGVPIVAAHKALRIELVRQQQDIAKAQSVVMEGRDITFRVLPDADMKIFLTATDTERARRRHVELLAKGEDVTFEQVHADLLERDSRDMERDVDPLHVVEGAQVIDTSTLSIEEVVDLIVAHVKQKEKSAQA